MDPRVAFIKWRNQSGAFGRLARSLQFNPEMVQIVFCAGWRAREAEIESVERIENQTKDWEFDV